METTKKQYNGQFRIVLYILMILGLGLAATSCTQTQALCPAYDSNMAYHGR